VTREKGDGGRVKMGGEKWFWGGVNGNQKSLINGKDKIYERVKFKDI